MESTNITDEHKRVFEMLKSGEYGNFALFSCFVNGEPGCGRESGYDRGPGIAFEAGVHGAELGDDADGDGDGGGRRR